MNDGGPAFPTSIGVIPKEGGGFIELAEYGRGPANGMSLRDYFAAAAMQGLLAMEKEVACKSSIPEDVEKERREFADAIANAAYRYADAMIAARKTES